MTIEASQVLDGIGKNHPNIGQQLIHHDFSKLDPEDTEAKGLLLEKIWDDKQELSDLLLKLFDKLPIRMIEEPSLA